MNGQLAFDASRHTRPGDGSFALQLAQAGPGPLMIEWRTANPNPFELTLISRHRLPEILTTPFLGNWPRDARPVNGGHRAELVQRIRIGVARE